jgi:GTP cyclohydrolase IA
MSAAPALFPSGRRPEVDPQETMDARARLVAARFRGVMEARSLDLDDPNLVGTSERVARSYRFLFSGLRAEAEPEVRTFPNVEGYSGMVAVTGIRFHSLCAHHFLPFFGVAQVAYLPKERLVGLSKLTRVVELFARRPQLQERLTEQIASFLDSRLQPAGVMIVVKARHFCMEMRGVRKAGARTTTSAVRGGFADVRVRREFLTRVRG